MKWFTTMVLTMMLAAPAWGQAVRPSLAELQAQLDRLRGGGVDLVYTSAQELTIPAGTVWIDGTGATNGSARLWSFDNPVGLAGLDTGTEANDVWYYLYAVLDPSGGFSAVGSLQPPVHAGGSGPTGYPVHLYLGSFYNTASGIRPFLKRGLQYLYEDDLTVANILATSPGTTWQSVDLVAGLPETAAEMNLTAFRDDDLPETAFSSVSFRHGGSSGDGHLRLTTQHNQNNEHSSASWTELAPASRAIEWRLSQVPAGPIDLYVYVNGYRE